MPMTMTEADAVSRLIRFVLAGEQYTGQAARSLPAIVARTAARDLEYLGERASKVLKITVAGDAETYAKRLEVLAAGSDTAAVDERTRSEVTRRIMRILDYGKTRDDPELDAMTVGQMADRIIALVKGDCGD
ncbi:MAG TPA: hypothetical protein VIP77_04765 [Jiangellaceae bacterium]